MSSMTPAASEGVREAVQVEGAPTVPTTELQATILAPAPPLVVVAPPATPAVTKRTTVDWIIDYAKTDRCECHRSGEVIGRNELRVMRRNTASTGFQMAYSYKVIPFFQMMSRMAAATSKPTTVAGLIGFGELTAADQEMLANLFRRYHDPADDFPPSEAKGQCAAAIRKHRRPQLERRFLCPAPGCTKAYSSAGCLSQHKRDKHPELLRGRPRALGDACPTAGGSLALAPPQGTVTTTSLTLSAIPAGLAPPDHQPHATAHGVACHGVACPPAAAAGMSCIATLEAGGGSSAHASAGAQPLMQAQHVLPPGMPPSAHAEPPRAAGYELEPLLPPPRKLQCPAPGCGKSYACSSSLYVHKRNKHPELIRPRGNQALRAEVGREVGREVDMSQGGVELVGSALMAAAEVGPVSGVEMASIGAGMAGAEMAGAEVLQLASENISVLGAGADMVGVEGIGGGGMGGGGVGGGAIGCGDAAERQTEIFNW